MPTAIPQLQDEDWLWQNADEPLRDLAHQLGCQPETVQKARQRAGIRKIPRPWNDLEREALRRFYGRTITRHLAVALNRGKAATHKTAHRLGLDGHHSIPNTLEAATLFWHDWRNYIAGNWDAWCDRGLTSWALQLIWRPPEKHPGGCSSCKRLPQCRQIPTRLPLLCERLTVEDLLRLKPEDCRLIKGFASNSEELW